MSADAELAVLQEQVTCLRAALQKVLDARENEAKAWAAYKNAIENFSDGGHNEAARHLAAMTAASDAEKGARLLLLTLRVRKVSS